MEPDATDNSKDDDELLLRILHGDETAWEQLVDSYKTGIYRTAYRVTCNEDDAFDATQETFMKIARNLPALRNRSTFRSWATSIAVREALNIHRKRARFPHAVDPETIATELDNQQVAHAHQAHSARCGAGRRQDGGRQAQAGQRRRADRAPRRLPQKINSCACV